MGYIIDISEHQKPININYDEFCRDLDLAIVRVQYGSNYKDIHYKTHIAELRKRGVPVHVYAWIRGVSNADMEAEAVDFYNRTQEVFNPDWYWLDVEEQSMPDMRTGSEFFRAKLKALGAKKVGVYVANHLYSNFNLDVSKFDAVWIPTYGANNGSYQRDPNFPCDLHQFTSVGRKAGYAYDLDLNRLTGSKPLDYFVGNATAPQPAPTQPVPQDNPDGFTITRWWDETGTFYPSEYCWIKYEPTESAPLCASLDVGETVSYYTVVVCDKHVWLKYTRSNGRVAYCCYADSPDNWSVGRKYGICK